MIKTINIGPLSLADDYQRASDSFVCLQNYANLLLEQMVLDLPVDAGLAYEINIYQEELKTRARQFFNQCLPEFIEIVSFGQNFNALFSALIKISQSDLRKVAADNHGKTEIAEEFHALAKEAGRINQVARAFATDVSTLHQGLAVLSVKFDAALLPSIKQLGASATSEAAEIDRVKKAIVKNIDDIVAGAHKQGDAVTKLGVGIITAINSAKPDAKPDGKKEKGEKNKDGGKKSAKEEKSQSQKSKSEKPGKDGKSGETPSTDFAVSAIHEATEGAALSSKASSDLTSNNKKLAKAYQKLATADTLLAVAKVVAVQNDMFIDGLKNAENIVDTLAKTWGQSPLMPPASGISLHYTDFGNQILGIMNSKDSESLSDVLEYAQTDWKILHDKLEYIVGVLISDS